MYESATPNLRVMFVLNIQNRFGIINLVCLSDKYIAAPTLNCSSEEHTLKSTHNI